ncbi:TetR family transcriptional regulator [Zhengella mangrovi]|uniref:TetR family transcriptional regulator n=1 Tax=Zhengella mangrovi TaxID=1982044 RepID=A0A2G1QIA6_9HYPH|nr:TetR/AcrR family transcriptional regulator [Zhengella mangrovi]PHP65256.1 TetR family transcriptional regulator [Zhengella mangrovi]
MNEQAKPGAPEEETSERARALLEIGARLFAEKGYEATSMRDISNAAGVSKALLYHHFASKDDIYARISFSATESLYSFVEARIPERGTAAEKVRAYMVAAAAFFSQHRSAWIAASNAFWSDPDRHRLETRVARRRQFEQRLRDLISEGVASGEFNAVDPAMAGRLILSGINWMHRWYDPAKGLTAEQIVDQYADILLGGLKKR